MERLTEETKPLAEEAVDRAKRIADRYARIFPEHRDDLMSASQWGAVRAAASFKPDLNSVWERWSELHIRGSIKRFLQNPYLRCRSLWPQEALQNVKCDSTETEAVEATDGLERLLAMLPGKHRRLCELIYGSGLTAKEAAVAIGYTPNHGDKLHKQAIEILREKLAA